MTYVSGFYYLPDEEDLRNHTIRFNSVDDMFKHWCTYGGYNLKRLEKDELEAVLFQIRYGNVPGLASSWRRYRKFETSEAILILSLFQFEEQNNKSWSVPEEVSLEHSHIFREGSPPLLKKQYPSLDELVRMALRSIKEFGQASRGGRSRNEGKAQRREPIYCLSSLACRWI